MSATNALLNDVMDFMTYRGKSLLQNFLFPFEFMKSIALDLKSGFRALLKKKSELNISSLKDKQITKLQE